MNATQTTHTIDSVTAAAIETRAEAVLLHLAQAFGGKSQIDFESICRAAVGQVNNAWRLPGDEVALAVELAIKIETLLAEFFEQDFDESKRGLALEHVGAAFAKLHGSEVAS